MGRIRSASKETRVSENIQKNTASLMFEVGKNVEVSSGGIDCPVSFSPAILVDVLRNGSYVVQYQSPKVGDEPHPLKVTVDPLHVRPCPPPFKQINFGLLDKVDAFFDNGWWSGVITKELEDNRYIVFYKEMKKEMEFHQMEIRPHIEWKDGKWITSSKNVIIPSSDNGERGSQIFTNSTEVAVPVGSSGNRNDSSKGKMPSPFYSIENQAEQLTPCNLEPSHVTVPFTASRHLSSFASPDTISHPLKNCKEGRVEGPSLALHQQTIFETPCEVLQDDFVSPTSGKTLTGSVTQPESEDLSNDFNWGRRIRKKGKQNNNLNSSVKNRRRTQSLQLGNPELATADVQEESVNEESGLGIVLGLSCIKIPRSRRKTGILSGERARKSKGEESLKLIASPMQLSSASAPQNIKESKESGTEVHIIKRKRGRPRITPIKCPETPVTGIMHCGEVVEDLMVTKDCSANEVGSHATGKVMNHSLRNQESTPNKDNEDLLNDRPKRKTMSVSVMRKNSSIVPGEEVSGTSSNPCEKNLRKRRKRRSADRQISSQFQGASQDETHSPGIEHTPSAFDSSAELPSKRTTEKHIETVKKQNEIAVQSDRQSLPFVKTTMLWKTIESMEVFRRMPQNPHFRPLESEKESCREGLAIGYMVNFSTVVENASSLRFDDPKSKADDILESLADLESQGFDVSAVRDRITGLGFVKERQENLMCQLEEINNQFFAGNLEIHEADEEIGTINQETHKLQEKLLIVKSEKEKKIREVASLQSKLREVKEGINSVECFFDGLVALPL